MEVLLGKHWFLQTPWEKRTQSLEGVLPGDTITVKIFSHADRVMVMDNDSTTYKKDKVKRLCGTFGIEFVGYVATAKSPLVITVMKDNNDPGPLLIQHKRLVLG